MNLERRAVQAVGALLVAALTFFFLQSRVDLTLPRQITAEVQALIQRDAMLNRDLVLARYGHLPHVDPLVDHVAALRRHVEALTTLALTLPSEARLRTQDSLATLDERLRSKAAHTERFKSDNAILHSSIAFFPLAVRDVLEELDNSTLDATHRLDAERATGILVQAVLEYTRPGGADISDMTDEAIERLRAATADGSNLLVESVERLTAHLNMIARVQGSLDDHLQTATTMPVAEAAQAIDIVTAEALADATNRAGLFRALLYGTAVLLAIYLAAILARLQVKALALKRANAELRNEMASRARAEDQLRITEKVFESAVEGVLVTDAAGAVASVNPAFTSITGIAPGEALGRHWKALTRGSRADTNFPSIARALPVTPVNGRARYGIRGLMVAIRR